MSTTVRPSTITAALAPTSAPLSRFAASASRTPSNPDSTVPWISAISAPFVGPTVAQRRTSAAVGSASRWRQPVLLCSRLTPECEPGNHTGGAGKMGCGGRVRRRRDRGVAARTGPVRRRSSIATRRCCTGISFAGWGPTKPRRWSATSSASRSSVVTPTTCRARTARPWLYGIATNLVAKHRRGEARRLRAVARLAAQRLPSIDLPSESASRSTPPTCGPGSSTR